MTPDPPLRLATYNVHGWVGTDRRRSPRRVMQVLNTLQADVLALQEATLPSAGGEAAAQKFLREHTGLHVALGFTMRRKDAHFGNILLSRLPFVSLKTHNLSFSDREPRGLIEAVVEHHGRRVQILATHLGLIGRERRCQAARILEIASPEKFEAVALLGDCNEWLSRSRALRLLVSQFCTVGAPRTFPAWLPLFALDRIMSMGPARMRDLRAHRQGEARKASDHLPLTASLHLG